MFKKFLLLTVVLTLIYTSAFALLTEPSDVKVVGGFTKVWLGWTVNHVSAEADSCGIFQIVGTDTTLKAYVEPDTLNWGSVDSLAVNINYALTVGVLDTSGTWVYSALVDSVTTKIPEQVIDDNINSLHYMKLASAESYTGAWTGVAAASSDQVRYLFDMDSSTDSDSSLYFHLWDFTAFYIELSNAVADSTKYSIYIKGCYGDPGSAIAPFVTVPLDTITVTSSSQQDNLIHMVDTTGVYTLYQWGMLEIVGDADCGVNQQFYIWVGRSRGAVPERRN